MSQPASPSAGPPDVASPRGCDLSAATPAPSDSALPPPPPAQPAPPTSVPVPRDPLVGAVGQEYVAAVLSSTDPRSALREVADAGGLKAPGCAPVLGLLDALGVSR